MNRCEQPELFCTGHHFFKWLCYLFDNSSKGYLDIGLTDRTRRRTFRRWADLLCYFRKNIDEIDNYTALTAGRQYDTFPLWVLGNFVSSTVYLAKHR